MTKKLVYFCLCTICFGSCKISPSLQEEIVIIDIDKAIGTPGELYSSDIADSISIIPIHDSSDAYIGDMLEFTEMTKNHIFTYDMLGGLVCYNFNEQKSCKIGVKGRGPQEYLYMKSIAVDEINNIIYALVGLADGMAVFKYNYDGTYMGRIPLKETGDNIGFTDDGYLVVHFTNFYGNGGSQYIVMDNNGKTVTDYPQAFSYESHERTAYFLQESIKYTYDGDLHMKDHSDTLYVFRGKERYPKYVFKNAWSIDGKKNLSQGEFDNALVVTDILETKTKLIFHVRVGGTPGINTESYELCYDKISGQLFSFDETLQNDLPPASTRNVRIRSNYGAEFGNCYGVIDTYTFLTKPDYPKDDDVSYILILLHLK
ncbi:MAG: 6-bladed beta-propeller [Alistipes sp.]|jgi:hypothetical protein|nr:6-bladed beta-propeller [Alistipes sp.]